MIVPSNEIQSATGKFFLFLDSEIPVNNFNSTESSDLRKVYYEVGCKIFEINKIFK
jgi:hypothetical protein